MKYKGCALFLIRLAVGVVFVYHGWAKVSDMSNTVAMFSGMGIPAFLTYIAAYTEFLGGIALIVGFNTRIAATLGFIVMSVAFCKVHWANGFNIMHGGYEYAMVLLANFAALVIVGGGRHSMDAMYGTCMLDRVGWCTHESCDCKKGDKKCDCC